MIVPTSSIMPTASSGMSAGTGLAAMSMIQGLSGAYSSYQQAKANKLVAESNRRIAEMKARDALKRGHETEARSRQSNRKVIGSQRAALAAQGIRVDFGSAADATPSAKNGKLFKTAGTTAITAFDDGVVGQTIKVNAASSITITDGASIILNGGANFAMVSGDSLTLTMYTVNVWTEDSRSVN